MTRQQYENLPVLEKLEATRKLLNGELVLEEDNDIMDFLNGFSK